MDEFRQGHRSLVKPRLYNSCDEDELSLGDDFRVLFCSRGKEGSSMSIDDYMSQSGSSFGDDTSEGFHSSGGNGILSLPGMPPADHCLGDFPQVDDLIFLSFSEIDDKNLVTLPKTNGEAPLPTKKKKKSKKKKRKRRERKTAEEKEKEKAKKQERERRRKEKEKTENSSKETSKSSKSKSKSEQRSKSKRKSYRKSENGARSLSPMMLRSPTFSRKIGAEPIKSVQQRGALERHLTANDSTIMYARAG